MYPYLGAYVLQPAPVIPEPEPPETVLPEIITVTASVVREMATTVILARQVTVVTAKVER